ncbi:Inactive dipeptidyl peptidase 10 [Acipenser ruthenus]|uniref:Inactive dipeptidyl peptidase 10 n=1 Tax=Acipenser ruthenus TaxID=7906 RepID=A0A444V7C2_ACIRT|nr:Inactive dipeptidyl peptidase 10 [Acipenser ruthenus]
MQPQCSRQPLHSHELQLSEAGWGGGAASSNGMDLGVSSRPPRNWKGICIAVVVIVVVMSLVILSIILLTPEESRLSLQSRFSLEDLAREEFKVHDPAVAWVSESEVTLRTREGHVIKRNLTLKASRFQVSPDLRFVLLAYNVQPMHSQSFSASYAIYSVDTREISELNPPEVKRSVLQFASWGPHGNQLVYVFENNIYYQPDASSSAQRLVSTGKEGVLLNGVSDWLYEEEVLQSYAAHWWSGDGARLAYLTINNSATPNMEIPHFLGGAYPSSSRYPYPKAGQPIPTVRLFVVNLYGLAHTLELIPPDSFRTSYFLSTENSPRSRHLYSVDVAGVFRRACVTCDLIADCTFFRAQFSPNMTSFTLHCGGPGVPKVSVHQTDDPSNYFILEDNEALEEALRRKRLPETEFQTIPADSYDLQLKLSLPVGYKDRVHPLLLVVDGTPGSQSVTEQFSLDWASVLSSSLGAVLARLDGRGSGNQGQKLQQAVRQKLGSAEVKDHLRAVEWLIQQPYIDHTRIALYGKAYGGYLTLKMLAATDGQFKCAAAFAPITDFSLYDAAFSERYLGLPSKEDGLYAAASLLEEAHRLRDERFLLIHGTADASVHFQHTAELLHRLVTVDSNYTLQIHPDEGHALQSDQSRQHLIRTLVRYFLGCLQNPRRRSSERQEDEY